MGQRSTENARKNESNKHRMGQNIERKKTLTGNNVEYNKRRMDIMSIGKKH
jgi:hypothetical protein